MKYKLNQVFELQMGKTPARNNEAYWGGTNKWISIADIGKAPKYISDTKECITDKGVSESGIKKVPQGTVIMSFKLSIGKTAITSEDMFTNEAIMAFIDRGVHPIDTNYFYHFCHGRDWMAGTNKAVMGLTLNKATLSDVEIDIPKIEQQREIASRLDFLDALIASRHTQLAKLDELVKSRFVELFGDSVTNSIGWDTDTVIGVCDDIYGGGTPSKSHPEYYENGDIPWVSSKDMKTDVLYDSQIKINQLGVDNSTAKMVPVNSVIMVIRSGILKHTLPVAINAVPITVNQDLKVFIPSKRILSTFLMYQFKMLEKDILSGIRAVTADNIEFDSLKKREIIVPPMELQEQFAAFVEQTDKSKLAIQKSLAELETLKKALMQKYFG